MECVDHTSILSSENKKLDIANYSFNDEQRLREADPEQLAQQNAENLRPRWEDMHIEDFQALPGIVLRKRIGHETIEALHTLGAKADALQTFKRHGNEGHWKIYLHKDRFIHKANPVLVNELRSVMEETDRAHWQLLTREPSVRVRLVEYHTYIQGGGLIGEGWEYRHFDGGSFLTMVVMLSDPQTDFEGGRLLVSSCDWASKEEFDDVDLRYPGDCCVFPSHKYHNVSIVTKGRRHVCVMELWGDYEGFEDARPGSWGSATDVSSGIMNKDNMESPSPSLSSPILSLP